MHTLRAVETLSGELLAFAEDPAAFVEIGPDQERVLNDRYCVTFSPGGHFWSVSVQRVRFGRDDVPAGVKEIRELMAVRDRHAAAWSVGPSATPPDLFDRLLELGMESESDEGSAILVLTEPPRIGPSPFQVRLVSTFEEHLAALEVAIDGFGFSEVDAQDERARARATFEAERPGKHVARLISFDGDRAVATGTAWFSPFGLHLGGGATLPAYRRRGAMTALVAAAWEEAARRGTPALATFGGKMAAPVLERMGFHRVGQVRHLVDRPETRP